MIEVNGQKLNLTKFPDGTTSFRYDVCNDSYSRIVWKYDGDHECILLWHLVNHIRAHYARPEINLYMPYIPNARMDRVKNDDEVFTLKWFANFLNAMHFDYVYVLDPHSNVSMGLIDNVVEDGRLFDHIFTAVDEIHVSRDDLCICFPDEGAEKRYTSALIQYTCVSGRKHRNWRTGKIESLEIIGADKVKDKTVLIVDDICSRGGTFNLTAKALLDAGAKEVFLCVTHCENTILEGTVLTDGLISHVYTTDSIFCKTHEKITVYEL